MNPAYLIRDTSEIYSPALIFYRDLIVRNLALAVEMARGPARLRPHAKTHKTREITRLELDVGITKHKCATLAEAEVLASCGGAEVFIAYPMVGPNCRRLGRLIKKYPGTTFQVQADHPAALRALSSAMLAAGTMVEVLLDLDVGMRRTGITPGPQAVALYEQIARSPGLIPGGLHAYDGQNHQEAVADRESAVRALLEPVLALRAEIEKKGLAVPRIVAGGTPTFPVWAKLDVPGLECSPGTLYLHDNGYGSKFADLSGFTPAALLLTRVISKPGPDRLTLDLGYKAVASDPPAGKRCVLLNVPDYEPLLQNEEHFALRTPAAANFEPGDEVYAVPTHICPTCAMHRSAYVVSGGEVVDRWEIVARDRMLTV